LISVHQFISLQEAKLSLG